MLAKLFLLSLSLLSPALGLVPRQAPSSSCKAFPGDAAWPSAGAWNALNRTVGGRLIATVPLPSVCHQTPFGTFNEDACAAMKTEWLEDTTFINHPAEVMNPPTQNYSCVPFTSSSQACNMGNYASYSINVTGADDVIAGIKFARENNVRLVIKNTGHDFSGKSTGPGALSLWTHNLNTTKIIENYEGAGYSGPAAKLGAGVISGQVYEVVGAAGYRVMGGTCPTVGLAGGYTSGGGHSLLNGAYGMAADAVLEWEVITADGKHLTASQSENSDLYWALSGGGAGTYAVVLSMTTKVFADGPIGSGILMFNITANATEDYWGAIEDLWMFLPEFVDAGPNSWDFALTAAGFQAYAITVPDKNGTEVQSLLQPWLSSVSRRGIQYSFIPTDSDNYLEYFSSRFGPGIAGAGPATVQLTSRLIPRAAMYNKTETKVIVDALRQVVELDPEASLGCHALNVANVEHPDNAVLPAWREAIATCNIVTYWDWDISEAEMWEKKDLLVDTLIPGLEEATPGSGTYLNEIDAGWKGDWITELYGENYDRLLSIKNKYDPQHVFYARTAIGSASWTSDATGRLCRV
uniref:FAD-linked oxidoreductase CalF n=1 Tax=Emericella variicolor TaxID=1549217 RepID=A0A679DSS5_EMEVA|nr:FAD-linked oxidoreductase CalF' [Aspergillus stellatus]BBM05079.1 putative FAD-binding domain-containing protein [Aspergillus stellatus]